MTGLKRQAEVLGDLGKVSRHPEVTTAQAYIREQGEEIATLRKQAAEQEAQAAAYRQALGTILDMPTGAGIGDHDDCSFCERRDEVAGAVWRSITAGQALLDRQRGLEEALKPFLAHARPHPSWPDGSPIGIPNITAGHVRRAAALLEQKGDKA